jgi:hypothetical protein
MEYGDFSPRFCSTGIWCCSQKFISASREFRSHSRQGAITLMSGFSA